jgi:hypothetical protein
VDIANAQDSTGLGLLAATDLFHLFAGDRWIDSTLIAIGADAVGDFDSSRAPLCDGATSSKIEIIRVSGYYKDAFNVAIEHRFHAVILSNSSSKIDSRPCLF